VLAAEAAGTGIQEFVDRNAVAFTSLAGPLSLSVDDTIRTSRDPRHRAGVQRLWEACAANGDLYRKHYEGLYCVGCEQFYTPAELTEDGRCPEHGIRPELVSEENWFFRLSRHAGRLREAIESGTLRIEPAQRRNEVLAFVDGGLEDFSVSRSTKRARGWGIPVPGDPEQVIYVWWDALGNYLTALNYGVVGEDSQDLTRWWTTAARRIHLLGKGVLRFHAVYWPAILLSAGEALPTDVVVHDYPPPAAARSASPAKPVPTRTRSWRDMAPMPCAGGCCARCRGQGTPTSRRSGWWPGPTTNWPTASATSSTAWSP
jgi:methionyl-tRNA synthetase